MREFQLILVWTKLYHKMIGFYYTCWSVAEIITNSTAENCHIDGLLYNYRISCFTNFTGDEKNCFVK